MDAVAEIGRNPVSNARFSLSIENEQADGTERLNSSRETKFSGAYGDRGIFILPFQLTTIRTGNLSRLIHTLLYWMTIPTYILVTRVGYSTVVVI